MISVAIFDLDDTLFAHRNAVRDGIAAHLSASLTPHDPPLAPSLARSLEQPLEQPLGQSLDQSLEQDRWDELEERHYTRYLNGELTYLGQRHARAREFMEAYGVSFPHNSDAEDWFDTYLIEYRRAWTLYDDAIPCLDGLAAAGVRIGMITNGVLDFQTAKLDALDLTRRIEHLVTSGEFGITKPDRRIFDHAVSLFGVEAGAALYIGDRLNTDAIGAAAAGLTGVWLDRSAAASAAELDAARGAGARVIHSLAELPAVLGL